MEEQDEGKLEFLLMIKEKRCSRLQERLEEEAVQKSKEEKAKRKRLKEMEEKFKKLRKTETSLNRSLAGSQPGSRSSTPKNSPKNDKSSSRVRSTVKKVEKKRVVSTKKATPRKEMRKVFGSRRSSPEEKAGEGLLLNSLLDLQHGNSKLFSELLTKALTAGENLASMSSGEARGGRKYHLDFSDRGDNVVEGDPGVVRAEEPRNLKDNNSIQGNGQSQSTDKGSAGLNNNNNGEAGKCECQLHMSSDAEARGSVIAKKLEDNSSDKVDKGKTDNEAANKKLQSGKTIKPDESDIKKQVKFAHQKLDPRHVVDRIFDKLTFPLLVAGELEIATSIDITEKERQARVNIAKVICYHKLYLSDSDLRNGYDAILKKVEQGISTWSDDLAEDLHRYYDYRANVLSRERIAAFDKGKGKFDKSEKSSEDKGRDDESGDESPENQKPIFCMDYNKGTCTHTKTHIGKWKGKRIKKWHICRFCLRAGELNNHPETDSKCPNKEQASK